MAKEGYTSMETRGRLRRRDFLKISGGLGTVVGTGLLLGTPPVWTQETKKTKDPGRIKTNIDQALAVPRTKLSLPGLFPGRVVELHRPNILDSGKPDPAGVNTMFSTGLRKLTGRTPEKSFPLFFDKNDVVGIKVNPVGPKLISTHLEIVDAVIGWLEKGGIQRKNIVIWDRFDYMLTDAGFTPERYPGIRIEGLQTMDEAAAAGKKKDDSAWLDKNGHHVSEKNFDLNTYYWADVEGPKDKPYLNQHVFNGKYSYFGKLLTKKLTKIINIPVFKNTGSGISMATKNLGYGSVCNTNRLHKPLFFNVCTEVLAFPAVRDKLVLNITDGLKGQYEGGPGPAPKYVWPLEKLFLATDPFALDMICHNQLVQKRKDMGVKTNEHPMYTEYLHYAQKLGLGISDIKRIQHIKA